MAFLIYKKHFNGGAVRYEKMKPLKLGGRGGLVAQHVKTLSEDELRSWKLDVPALLKLAGVASSGANHAILFDLSGREATSVCLYELSRVHGSCRDTSTQLALDFAVVIDQEIGEEAAEYINSFEVTPPAKPKLLGETLALSGGPGGGDWTWGGTSLQLGATVVQAQPGNGHGTGTGEPCPSCTCGRREAMYEKSDARNPKSE
jgi:hypothetical protein